MSQSDEQQIRDVIDTWIRASREGDLATVMGLMTEDVVFLTPGNAPMRREDFAAAANSMAGKIKIDGRPEIQEITVTGDLAICWNRLEMVATPLEGNGTPVKRKGSTLSVFRRGQDGKWRIWRDANMLGPASPA
jgi:uncharacterized protein (TIGR02246 family)